MQLQKLKRARWETKRKKATHMATIKKAQALSLPAAVSKVASSSSAVIAGGPKAASNALINTLS